LVFLATIPSQSSKLTIPATFNDDLRTHMPMTLEEESRLATEMLSGKAVARVIRHRATEVLIEFTDGTRLFVDQSSTGVELSITGGKK
jgi:hypothetical protein